MPSLAGWPEQVLGEDYGDSPASRRAATAGSLMNDDVYVAPQFRQAIHEFSLGDPAKLSSQDLR